nr:zinc finger BED domain-containing protein RICESLEEPER 2-like [Ipomoea batatas]
MVVVGDAERGKRRESPGPVASRGVFFSHLCLGGIRGIRSTVGVYVMCHMETYVGQGVSKWVCGLTKGDTAKLQQHRLHYMKEITTSEYNLHRCAFKPFATPFVIGYGRRLYIHFSHCAFTNY